MHPDVERIVSQLSLVPHPEGGFFRETFRAPLALVGLPHGQTRVAQSSVYFLLPSSTFSALHRVRSDEVWHFYDGDPLELHILDEWEHRVVLLGRDLAAGQVPQCVVPAGLWQAAKPLGDRFSLCGCTVAPGFEWEDFEMPSTDELMRNMPQHETVIRALSRTQRPPGMGAQ